MKVMAGEPIKGNTISRKIKAANRAATIHAAAATVFSFSAGCGSARGDYASLSMALLGTLASFSSVCSNLFTKNSLKTEYNEIKTRAKQIYKK